ncbi:hypothetical protein [Paenibacillus apii]|uniref:hypothetical protein n=1 Tax=Paenibacillus apii TaxID=1850370 RepID=UPI0014392DE1|nr:hypothetical protein [Paenibacillus apii]NJJ41294.1 hypothetical protein [Paenibacillus apii]
MAELYVRPIIYGNYGKCVEVTNGTISLVATVEFGPRIIRFGFTGGDNVFFEDTERQFKETGGDFSVVGGGEWHIYGGHRLWTSPESVPRTIYPDNGPVRWRTAGNGIVLTPDTETWTHVQKEIEVQMNPESGEVTIHHRITNTGAWPVTFAPWALSVMAEGGKAIIPQAKRETLVLPNRVLALWPESQMNDHRVYWGERYILLQQDETAKPFKFGTNNDEGWAAYFNKGQLFIKTYLHNIHAVYPDYGVSFECYTNHLFLELETLGELKTVAPLETVSHTETWKLIRNASLSLDNENELESAIRPYLNNEYNNGSEPKNPD